MSLAPMSLYLISQESRDARFRGVTDGRQVVAPLEGQDDAATSQAHQLLGQVPKTCKGEAVMQKLGRGS